MNEQAIFFDACRNGRFDEVKNLYTSNPEIINVEDVKGFTPLIIAVYNEQQAVVEFLLEKGALADVQDKTGNTALMGACFKGYRQLATILINAGADVNQRNFQGATALTFAATFGQLEIAEMLLKKGADVFAEDVRGKNPIDHAIIQENPAMVTLMQQYLPKIDETK